jgi:hypothetical protein
MCGVRIEFWWSYTRQIDNGSSAIFFEDSGNLVKDAGDPAHLGADEGVTWH